MEFKPRRVEVQKDIQGIGYQGHAVLPWGVLSTSER